MADAKIKNRRRGPDIVIKAIKVFVAVSWFVLIGLFIAFSLAKPRLDGMTLGGSAVGGIDKTSLKIAFNLMIIQALLCAVGIVISTSRLKRKSDKMNLSLVVFEIIAIIGIISYLIF